MRLPLSLFINLSLPRRQENKSFILAHFCLNGRIQEIQDLSVDRTSWSTVLRKTTAPRRTVVVLRGLRLTSCRAVLPFPSGHGADHHLIISICVNLRTDDLRQSRLKCDSPCVHCALSWQKTVPHPRRYVPHRNPHPARPERERRQPYGYGILDPWKTKFRNFISLGCNHRSSC
jgi:hypothetical protein